MFHGYNVIKKIEIATAELTDWNTANAGKYTHGLASDDIYIYVGSTDGIFRLDAYNDRSETSYISYCSSSK